MKTISLTLIALLLVSSVTNRALAEETNTAKIDSAHVTALNSLEKQVGALKTSLDSVIHHSVEQDSVIRTNPYTVSIGASFDFIEGLKSPNVYAELNVFLPNLWGPVDEPWKSIGLYAGVYQGRSYFERVNETYLETYSVDTNPTDSILAIINREVNVTTQREQVNLCLYLSPTVKTLNYLYIAPHFEVRTIDLISSVEETILRSDTSEQIVEPDTSQSVYDFEYVSSSWSTKTTFGEGYFGLGPLLYYTDDQVDFLFKATFGICFYNGYYSQDAQRSFAMFQFKLIEKSLGVKFGGEIRLQGESTPNSGGLELQIYLTKDFTLKKLRELF